VQRGWQQLLFEFLTSHKPNVYLPDAELNAVSNRMGILTNDMLCIYVGSGQAGYRK
jgi:hypothetical protein